MSSSEAKMGSFKICLRGNTKRSSSRISHSETEGQFINSARSLTRRSLRQALDHAVILHPSSSLSRNDERVRFEDAGVVDPVFADDLHVEAGQIDEESSLDLVDALLKNVFGLVDGDVGVVVPIHHRHGEEGTVAVGGERLLVHGRQVVHVEESRSVVLVPSADEQIDVVGSARTEEVGQVFASVMSRRFWREVVPVAILVQLNILTDELRELGSISSLSDHAHESFPAERKHFVVVMLHRHDASGRNGVGGHEHKVRPLDADKELHRRAEKYDCKRKTTFFSKIKILNK